MSRKFMVAALGCLFLAACGPSENALTALGSRGEIQLDAPVKASSSVVIDAAPQRVWNILVDVGEWPHWQHDVDHVSVDGPLGKGVSFGWSTGGTAIRSRVVLFVPDKAITWTGRASVAKAVHVLRLTALDAGRTRVESMESMDGPLLSWFYSSSDLQGSEDQMLKSLKAAAETPYPLQESR